MYNYNCKYNYKCKYYYVTQHGRLSKVCASNYLPWTVYRVGSVREDSHQTLMNRSVNEMNDFYFRPWGFELLHAYISLERWNVLTDPGALNSCMLTSPWKDVALLWICYVCMYIYIYIYTHAYAYTYVYMYIIYIYIYRERERYR